MGIGETFKKAREARGLSLEEVAENTKIRYRYLEAIEKENFKIIPGHVYGKGFIRNYARYLGINPEPLTALFDEHQAREQINTMEALLAQEEKDYHFRWKPLLIYIIIAAALCLIIFGIYVFRQGILPQQGQNNTPILNDINNQSTPEQSLKPPQKPDVPWISPAPQETPHSDNRQKGINLVLNVIQDSCWMSVKVDGEIKFTGILTARQTQSFSGKERIEIRLGNAGAVQVLLNGRNLGYLGGKEEVINREFIATTES